MFKKLISALLFSIFILTGCSSKKTERMSIEAENTVKQVSKIYGEQNPQITDIKTTLEETTKKTMYLVSLKGSFQKGELKSQKLEFSITEDGKKVWALTSDSWEEKEVDIADEKESKQAPTKEEIIKDINVGIGVIEESIENYIKQNPGKKPEDKLNNNGESSLKQIQLLKQIKTDLEDNKITPEEAWTRVSEIKSAKNKISNSDIDEAKKVLENHMNALKNSDLDSVNKTLGQYQKGRFNKDNLRNWKPQIVSISYPGKHTNDDIPPQSYKSNYGKEPYKSLNLYVVCINNNEKQEMDYILVKESEESPWVIHDWGR